MAKKTILVKVTGALTDPNQYKPLSPEFEFEDMYVQVPAEYEKRGDMWVLQPAAFEDLLGELALIVAQANDNYQTKRKEM